MMHILNRKGLLSRLLVLLWMSKIELEYRCKKCGNAYPATINYSGNSKDIDSDDNQSRCPFCGEWNCASPEDVRKAIS